MAPTPDIALWFYTLTNKVLWSPTFHAENCSDLSFSFLLYQYLILTLSPLLIFGPNSHSCYCFFIHTDLFFVLWSLTLRPVIIILIACSASDLSLSHFELVFDLTHFQDYTEDCFMNPDTQSHTLDYFISRSSQLLLFYDPHLSPRREMFLHPVLNLTPWCDLWSLILTTVIALGYCICHTCSCSMILTLTPLIALLSALSHLILPPDPQFHTLYWSLILNFTPWSLILNLTPNIDTWSSISHLILWHDPQFHTQYWSLNLNFPPNIDPWSSISTLYRLHTAILNRPLSNAATKEV